MNRIGKKIAAIALGLLIGLGFLMWRAPTPPEDTEEAVQGPKNARRRLLGIGVSLICQPKRRLAISTGPARLCICILPILTTLAMGPTTTTNPLTIALPIFERPFVRHGWTQFL